MPIRQRSRRIRASLALVLGLAVVASACTQDSVGTFRSPDATTEVGTADTGPREDTRYVPDTNIENNAGVVPDSPAENAYCNDANWCWLHPAPIPHQIRNLQRVDDRVFGVAYAEELQGFQPVIWEDGQMEILPKPVPPVEDLSAMTTSEDGWLALGIQGTVYDIGPEGVRQSRELSAEFPTGISGNGIDNFLTHVSGEVLLMRDGRLTREEPAKGHTLRADFMWPNGEILGISEGGEHAAGTYESRLNGRWRILPLAFHHYEEEFVAVGPNPELECASEGTFAGTRVVDLDTTEGALYRWDAPSEVFTDVAYDGSGIRSIGCSPAGQLLLTNDDGQILTRTGTATPFWERSQVTDEPVDETEVVGDDLYASSSQGDHAVVGDSTTLRLGSGFRVPAKLHPADEPLGTYSDFWVSDDAETIVLSHDRGLFLGTQNGWSRMASSSAYDFQDVQNARVWGVDEPRFAASGGTFWRWDGEVWVDVTEDVFGTSHVPIATIISFAADDMWLRADGNLYHHDGNEWSNVSAPGSSLSILMEAENLDMNGVFGTDDERLLFGADGSLYRLERDAENWSISLVAEPPCNLISDVLQTDDGSLWVVGRDTECIASREGDSWTRYTWPTDGKAPPGTDFADDTVQWVRHPSSNVPVLVTKRGILEPQSDGTFHAQFIGDAHKAVHLDSPNMTLVLSDMGVIANYE